MSNFRVTQNLLVDRSVGSLQSALSRLADLQEQMSTGRKLNRPSDSPTDTSQAMRLRASLSAVEQNSRNAADGLSRLGLADQTLTTVSDLVAHARDLAVQGANSGSASQSSRDALATELDQVRASLLDQSNATYLSRPVFGGITAGDKAYDDNGNYIGTEGEVTRKVSDGVRVRVDVDGKSVFGDGAASVFSELSSLSTALRSGDDAGITAGITALTNRTETVSTAHAELGATYNRIEQAQTSLGDAKLNLTNELSNVENIDLPATMVDLNMQEVAYQSALGATARVMQPSLLDFLR